MSLSAILDESDRRLIFQCRKLIRSIHLRVMGMRIGFWVFLFPAVLAIPAAVAMYVMLGPQSITLQVVGGIWVWVGFMYTHLRAARFEEKLVHLICKLTDGQGLSLAGSDNATQP